MSVLKAFRNTSSMQFITDAVKIHKDVIVYVIKLSNKYTKTVENSLVDMSIQLIDAVTTANAIRAVDDETFKARQNAFKRAKQLVHMLSIEAGVVFDLAKSHELLDKVKNIDHICQSLGENLEKEIQLIDGIMASDRRRYKGE